MRVGVLAGLIVLALAPVPRAEAAFHFIVVQEIFPGTPDNPSAQFVELRMFANNQQFVGGHKINVFNADGSAAGTFATFPGPVANGVTNRRVLACTAAAQTLFSITCDAVASGSLVFPSGKVAWENVDIVTYGQYTGPTAGSARPAGFLVRGRSLERKENANGTAQDTGDSASDFRYTSPTPTNNAGETGALPPGDFDQDGIQDGADNCPGTANAGQQDADADGLGDACDFGPVPPPPCFITLPNPLDPANPICIRLP